MAWTASHSLLGTQANFDELLLVHTPPTVRCSVLCWRVPVEAVVDAYYAGRVRLEEYWKSSHYPYFRHEERTIVPLPPFTRLLPGQYTLVKAEAASLAVSVRPRAGVAGKTQYLSDVHLEVQFRLWDGSTHYALEPGVLSMSLLRPHGFLSPIPLHRYLKELGNIPDPELAEKADAIYQAIVNGNVRLQQAFGHKKKAKLKKIPHVCKAFLWDRRLLIDDTPPEPPRIMYLTRPRRPKATLLLPIFEWEGDPT